MYKNYEAKFQRKIPFKYFDSEKIRTQKKTLGRKFVQLAS